MNAARLKVRGSATSSSERNITVGPAFPLSATTATPCPPSPVSTLSGRVSTRKSTTSFRHLLFVRYFWMLVQLAPPRRKLDKISIGQCHASISACDAGFISCAVLVMR
jgi:hypothetical protein